MKYLIFAILSCVKLLFIYLCKSGFSSDVMCFASWSERVYDVGFFDFYSNDYFCDYPPGYIFVLYIIGFLSNIFYLDFNSFGGRALLCLPSILAEFVLSVIVYRLLVRKNVKFAFGFSIIAVVLNPLFILNTVLWGQIDSYFGLFLVLSFLSISKNKYLYSALYFSLAFLVKPQALIFAPIFIYTFISSKSIKKIFGGFVTFILPVIVFSILFQGEQGAFWLVEKYLSTLGQYEYFTVNAYNIYMLLGLNWQEIGDKWSVITYIVPVVATIICFYYLFKQKGKKSIFFATYILNAVMFMLSVKMHERYSYIGVIFLVFAFAESLDSRVLKIFILSIILNIVNIGLVLYAYVVNGTTGDFEILGAVCAFFNICLFAYSLYVMFTWDKKKEVKESIKSKSLRDIFVDLILVCSQNQDGEGDSDIQEFNKNNRGKIIFSLLIIVVLYSCVAFYKLGDFEAPQTFYTTQGDEQIVMDFGEPKYIDKLMFYTGIEDKYKDYSEDRGYDLYYSQDAQQWFLADDDMFMHKYTRIFYWSSIDINKEFRYFMIIPNREGMMVGELGFFDAEGNLVAYSLKSESYSSVGDEQDKVSEESSYMNSTYFDEVYFPKTAYEILNKLQIYETTHPPLGKVIMAASMYLLGTTPFAYRLMGTLSGIIMLPVLYLVASKLLRNRIYALFVTAVFSLDFMHFTQTRIATIDSFSVLFILCMYKFILDYEGMQWKDTSFAKRLIPLFICSLFFGLGAATKWICVFTAFSLAFVILYSIVSNYRKISLEVNENTENKTSKSKTGWFLRQLVCVTNKDNLVLHTVLTFVFCFVFFVVVSLAVYCISYIPQTRYDLAYGQSFMQYVIESQKFMFGYHAYLESEHPFSSKWYEWPLITRPLFAYISRSADGDTVSSISSFGNPAIWWFSLWTIIFLIVVSFRTKDKKGMFIAVGYIAQFLPWCFIQRTTFIYHYFASVPFAVLSIGYFFENMFKFKTSKKLMVAYLIICLLLFVMFYPVISGQEISVEYISNFLQWSKKWVFY